MTKFLTKNFYRVDVLNTTKIFAGTYGNIIKQYQVDISNAGLTRMIKLAMESEVENYRLQYHPAKPSRFTGAFVFITESDAKMKFNELQSGKGVPCAIYEVSIDDINAKYHIGSYDEYLNIKAISQPCPFIPRMEMFSELYWNSVPSGVMEVLIESDLTVVRTIP